MASSSTAATSTTRRPANSAAIARSPTEPDRLSDRIPEELRPGLAIVRRLAGEGWETYLVGGAVRDLLLGRRPTDLDIVTAAPADTIARLFEHTVPVGAEFGVIAVVIDGRPYQVATFRREGPYRDGRRPSYVEGADAPADVLRRDFTVNALLYNPLTDEIVDLVGGQTDLQRRIIRTVGDPAARLAEDRLRMLRAVRLAAELGFSIEPATLEAVRTLAPTVVGVSAERIRDELSRLVVAPGRADAVRLLAASGLLRAILPEVAALEGVLAEGAPTEQGSMLHATARALGLLRRPSLSLAVATLVHALASDQVEAVCRRLRFSAAQRRTISSLTRARTAVPGVPRMRPSFVRGLVRHLRPADVLELYRVTASPQADPGVYARAAEVLVAQAAPAAPPLLTGHDLLALGYLAGPGFTEILQAVEEARERGDVSSRAEARRWVLARFPAGGGGGPEETEGGFDPPATGGAHVGA